MAPALQVPPGADLRTSLKRGCEQAPRSPPGWAKGHEEVLVVPWALQELG